MPIHPIHGVGSPAQPGAAPAVPGVAAGSHRPHDLVDVSPAAALLRRLDAVLRESPERFRAVTARVAERLGAQAPRAEAHQAQALARLSERFLAASQAGSAGPLVAEHGQPRPAPAALPGLGVPNPAALAALAAAAAAAPARRARPALRVAYRAKVERAGGEASDGSEPGGGLLGALLSAAAGLVEEALDAVLREAPPPGTDASGARPRSP